MALDKSALVYLALIILAIGIAAVAFAKPEVVTISPGAEQNTIDVSADGVVSADPDFAEIFITVETTSGKAETAQSENAATVAALRQALTTSGLVDDVRTTSFNLYPNFFGEGFTVSHSLKVSTDSTTGVGRVLDLITAQGVTRIDYIQFSLSEDSAETLKQAALKTALDRAENKARALASAAGVGLGKAVKISETSFFSPPIFFAAERAVAAEGVPTTVVPGQIEVSATVAVSYEIA